MDIKNKIRLMLREAYGVISTNLEIEYENRLINNLAEGSVRDKNQWITYNQIVLEVKHNLKNMLIVRRLQYELTDEKNPNEVCINVLESVDLKSKELVRLYDKVRNF